MPEPSEQKTPPSEEPAALPYAPVSRKPKAGDIFLSCVIGAAIVAALAWAILPSLPHNRPTRSTMCAVNLRSIGLGVLVYADRNNGQFPSELATLLHVGLCAEMEFICPFANHKPPACDYYYVTGLTADDPDDWIVAYADPTYAKGKGANILYCDRHVTFVAEPRFSQKLQRFKAAYEQARGTPPTIIPPK